MVAAPAVQTLGRRLRLDILTRGRVVLIGLGGTGLILARHVVLFLSAFRTHEFRVIFVDGDAFAPENTYRMDVPGYQNKAAAVAGELGERFGRPGLHLRWIPEYVTPRNVKKAIAEGDCVLAAVDNHATRRVIGRRCSRLKDVVLISGGNDGVEDSRPGTYANVQVYVRARGRDLHPTLDRFHPEIARPADRNPAELDCMELAAGSAPQLLFSNLAVASAMCNALFRLLTPAKEPMYDEVSLDIFEAISTPHWFLSAGHARAHAVRTPKKRAQNTGTGPLNAGVLSPFFGRS
ncbi:MAG TPA: ThiF family adenylyltransferase [Gemmataceae bacterium]|nr:ThiF family adenylyltransferase [Gemmataceae bacterium]